MKGFLDLVASNKKRLSYYAAGICLLKVSNRNTRTRCEICSKLTIKFTFYIYELSKYEITRINDFPHFWLNKNFPSNKKLPFLPPLMPVFGTISERCNEQI